MVTTNRVKKPRGIRHDRDCNRCKVRGVKCDLNRPQCQSCLQGGEACQYPQRVVWMGDKKSGASNAPPEPESTSQTSRNDHKATPEITTKPTSVNIYGFIDLIGAFHQQICSSSREIPAEGVQLISRILNFARSRIEDTDNNQSIQSHLVALTNLSQVIESGHPIALFGIATFAMFEVCCGSFGNWHCHLQGARSLLDLHCRNRSALDGLCKKIPGLADVLVYLVWFDVTGALVRRSSLIFDDWHRDILDADFFDSVGCPVDTFELCVYLAKHYDDHTIDVMDLVSRAMNQVLHLDADPSEMGLAATVYRGAGALLAFARAGGLKVKDMGPSTSTHHSSAVCSMVNRVCAALAKIPSTSRFYVHLATPAYLTGMHGSTAQQCAIIQKYWRNCQSCEFPRYPDAEAQCDRRWKSISLRG